ACYDDEARRCARDESPLRQPFTGERLLDRRYRLERCLGRGGMGAVYRAVHVDLDKPFALKVILPELARSETFLARFRLEAKALGQLRHPNVVTVTDYGVDERTPKVAFLVTELLEGKSLHDLVHGRGPLAPAEVAAVLDGVAAGLAYAHEA